jgi:Raf kinase inhibitor-like YbhB/YbcL family protein
MISRVAAAAALLVAAASAGAPLQLRSADFSPGGKIGRAQMAADCGGENRPPSLAWTGAPAGTRSWALVLHDPDAPVPGGFYHWVVYGIPPHTTRLGTVPPGASIGLASTGRAAYYGPCPPAGPAHHYRFTLYALDRASLGDGSPLTGPQVEAKVRGHVLARATLDATAARP